MSAAITMLAIAAVFTLAAVGAELHDRRARRQVARDLADVRRFARTSGFVR